ncbi:hypothetical protein ACFQY9_21765 [Microvirga aerilata]|uniref:hypothetical protein n=1 Tax=Microvirga aerilata TaxID=670292 RepID=UPI0036445167
MTGLRQNLCDKARNIGIGLQAEPHELMHVLGRDAAAGHRRSEGAVPALEAGVRGNRPVEPVGPELSLGKALCRKARMANARRRNHRDRLHQAVDGDARKSRLACDLA